MKTTQAWGWLAAGVLALGLNGLYHDGGAAWAGRAVDRVIECIAERSQPVLALATGRVDRFVAKARMEASRSESVSCRVGTLVACLRSSLSQENSAGAADGFARIEEMSAREEAALDRWEANRSRIEAKINRVRIAPADFNPVMCPRLRVSVPRVHISVPVVHVDPFGAGPI